MNDKEKIEAYKDLPVTLRDYFAGQMLTTIFAEHEDRMIDILDEESIDHVVDLAYFWADCMLRKRDINWNAR